VLLTIEEKSVLEHAMAPFIELAEIGAIVIVTNTADRAEIESHLRPLALEKQMIFVNGGARRIDSVANGVRAAPGAAELVAIHDAARPLIQKEIVLNAISAAARSGGAVVAVGATDTIKRSAGGRFVDITIPRNEIFHAQTPQIFRRREFLAALDAAIASGDDFTDDAAVAERAGVRVEIVKGDSENIKITIPSDLPRAAEILAQRNGAARDIGIRVGSGFDIHALVAGRKCILGGVVIDSPVGPHGHSDGDALSHSLADAILGAAGLDDLGTLFPDRDPKYKDMDSRDILKACVAKVHDAGFRIVNADCILILERPKIAPHRAAIRASVAKLLQVGESCVNVKGKTAEGYGDIGQGRAIAAQSTVLLQRIHC